MTCRLQDFVKKPKMKSQSLQFNEQIMENHVASWMECCQMSYFYLGFVKNMDWGDVQCKIQMLQKLVQLHKI